VTIGLLNKKEFEYLPNARYGGIIPYEISTVDLMAWAGYFMIINPAEAQRKD